MKRIIAFFVMVFALAATAAAQNKTQLGALIGASVGSQVGCQYGGCSQKARLIGAGLGAIFGGIGGHELDKKAAEKTNKPGLDHRINSQPAPGAAGQKNPGDWIGDAPEPGATIAVGTCQGLQDILQKTRASCIYPRDILYFQDAMVGKHWTFDLNPNKTRYVADITVSSESVNSRSGYSYGGVFGIAANESDVVGRTKYLIQFIVRSSSDLSRIRPESARVEVLLTEYRDGTKSLWLSGYGNTEAAYQSLTHPEEEVVKRALDWMLLGQEDRNNQYLAAKEAEAKAKKKHKKS